jgi:hypothetical protein
MGRVIQIRRLEKKGGRCSPAVRVWTRRRRGCGTGVNSGDDADAPGDGRGLDEMRRGECVSLIVGFPRGLLRWLRVDGEASGTGGFGHGWTVRPGAPEVKWRGPGDAHRGGGRLVPKGGGGLARVRQKRPHTAADLQNSGEQFIPTGGVSGPGSGGDSERICGGLSRASKGCHWGSRVGAGKVGRWARGGSRREGKGGAVAGWGWN